MTFQTESVLRISRKSLIALVAISMAVSPLVHAEEPTSAPTTPTTSPTSAPATTRAAKLPTPAELIAQMKAKQKETESLPKVAFIELSGPIVEKGGGISFFGGATGTPFLELLKRIKTAREDKDVRALVIVVSPDFGISLAQAGEVRELLGTFRKAGKRVFVYADSYDTTTYMMASGASDVVLLEGGELFMPGIGLESQFYKGLMDKVGVKGDYVQIGEYKGAEEPYTRAGASEQLKGEMTKLVDGLYTQVTAGIAKARGLPVESIQQAIDDAMIAAPAAKDRKLVDHLADRDSLRTLVESELNVKKINVINNYSEDAKPELDFSNPFAFLAQIAKKPEPTSRDTVAIVYADGTIVDGNGGGGGLLSSEQSVGSEDIRQAMRSIKEDANVKAIVIRIDSPGGSALASEVMWQAVRKVAAEKPVVISVGSMAASGGYYLASAGDHIVAEPTGIVGSIGVVGGKFVLKGLYEKLGIGSETFSKGRNADLFSSSTEWTERQRRMVANMMRTTYDQFTDRIMTTRRGKIADIDQVARGRIFVSADALKLGMVDELGGISDAIRVAASRAELKDTEYDLRTYPQPRGLAELFAAAPGAMTPPTAEAGVLRLLPASQRKQLSQAMQFFELLNRRPVVLHAPFTLTVR